MKKIEKNNTFNARFGISLEESASLLTKGGSGGLIEDCTRIFPRRQIFFK